MSTQGYQQFCPIAMACGMLEPRWTMLVLCEMWAGSTRFSEIQRGVPGMSPSLLSRRLKEMEAQRLLTRTTGPDGHIDYRTTPMADELMPLVYALGAWAHRHVDPDLQLECLDDHLLMWKIRRKIQVSELPPRKVVIQFIFKAAGKPDCNYWLIIRPDGETDLCMVDPRFDVDLYVSADLRAFTSAWMGHSSFADEIGREAIVLIGDQALARSMPKWLRQSSYAASGQKAMSSEREPASA
jgi:DNA-binding HxlR family transcriptional regulator